MAEKSSFTFQFANAKDGVALGTENTQTAALASRKIARTDKNYARNVRYDASRNVPT